MFNDNLPHNDNSANNNQSKQADNQEPKTNLDLNKINQGKTYPFKKVNSLPPAEAQQPVDDIFSETDKASEKKVESQPPNLNFQTDSETFVKKEEDSARLSSQNSISNIPPVNEQSFSAPHKKNKVLIILLLIFLIIVFVLLAIFVYQYFNSDKTKIPETSLLSETQQSEQKRQEIENFLDIFLDETEQETDQVEELDTNTDQPSSEQPDLYLDSDGDGLTDIEEISLGTNPYKFDTDDDGLNDFDEVKIYKTDPLNPDTDGDGYLDGEEVEHGYHPLIPGNARL